MKINIRVRLFAPTFSQWLGGANPPIAEQVLEVEVTQTLLEEIFYRCYRLEGQMNCTIEHNQESGIFLAEGNLPNENASEVIALLKAAGWSFDEKLCLRYEIQTA